MGELTRHTEEMVITIVFLVVGVAVAEDVTVNLAKGKIMGERLDYDFGQYYYAFKGIPYAKPPVKELRFKPPLTKQVLATKDFRTKSWLSTGLNRTLPNSVETRTR